MGIRDGIKRVGRFFTSFTGRVYRGVAAGPLGRLFGGYDRSNASFQNTGLVRLLRPKPNRANVQTVRRTLAGAMDQSLLRRTVYGALNALCRCSLRTVGVFFAVMGVYSVAISWMLTFLWQKGTMNGFHTFLSVAFVLFGILLMFSGQSVGYALENGRLTGGLLHRLLGVSADYIKQIPAAGVQMYAAAVPLGMLIGTAIALTGPIYPTIAILLAALTLLTLTTPEAGILLLLLSAPFLGFLPYPTLWPALGVALCGFGYLFKVLRGTRAFRIEVQDFIVLLFLILTLCSAVSAAGGGVLWSVLLSALLTFVYFPAVNVLATPNWLKRCRWGLLFSSTVTAMIGILQFLLQLIQTRMGAGVSLDELGASVRVGFSSNVVLAYFMVLAFPFALHAFLRATSASHRIVAGFSGMAILAATVLTWVQNAWLALAIEVIVLLLLCKRESFIYILFAALLLPVALFVIPESVREAIFSFMGVDAPVKGTAIASQLFFGSGEGFFGSADGTLRMLFGVGAGGMERIAVLYALPVGSGISFWWARWFESGILGILVPAVCFFFLLQNCFSLLGYDTHVQSSVAPASGIAMTAGFLLTSAFNDVGSEPIAILLFFLLVSIVTADARNRRSMRGGEEEKIQSPSYVEVEYRARSGRHKNKDKGEEMNTHEQQ